MTERRCYQVAAWLLAGLALPAFAWAEPSLWSVHGRGGTVWLSGSVHALAPGDFAIEGGLARAWQRADAVWLEIDPQELAPEAATALVAARAIDPAGRRLQDLLGTDAAAIHAAAAAAAVDLDRYAAFEPWFAATMITLQALAGHGYRQQDGVEHIIERQARADGKRVHGLEGMEEQLALLDGLEAAQQRDFLRQTLDEYPRIGEEFARLKAVWQAGDDEALAALLEQEFAPYPGLAEALVFARNHRWAARIAGLLEQDSDALVVVGALHLVGERGLPQLLAAQGFKVTRH